MDKNKNKKYLEMLIGLIMIDTASTILCVSMGAVELNPLCNQFHVFIYMKIAASVITCAIIYVYLLEEQCTKPMLTFLILWYTIIIIANTGQYVRWVLGG